MSEINSNLEFAMFFRSIFILSFSAYVSITNPASAASAEAVLKVANMVTDNTLPALLRRQELVEGEYVGNTAVFICNGMRYTLYNSGERINPKDPQSAWLSFWVRQDGTSGKEALTTFSDHGFDGIADYGSDGLRERIFITEAYYATGSEHQPYWQQRLDEAIESLLNCNQ